MTTELRRTRLAGGDWDAPGARQGDPRHRQPSGSPASDGRGSSVGGWLARHPAWPITALLVAYPLWWALGIGDYVWILLAIPMATRMFAWSAHGGRLRFPPGFGVWLLFLICSAAGVIMLTQTAPGTVGSPLSNRLLSYAVRTASYIALTVLLLYAGNLTENELPRRKLAWLLGLFGIYITVLGVAGILLPNLQFSSPLVLVLPHSLQDNATVQASLHPGLTQVQDVFGTSSGQARPKAPFDYTNTWGQCLTLTIPWLLLVCQASGKRSHRIIGWATTALAVIALIYSLNRGAWIGAGFAVVYLAARLAARGRVGLLGGLVAALVAVIIIVIASPLQNVISQRLQNGESDNIRSSLFSLAIRDGLASPVIGYGDTRQQRGSPNSVAVGPSATCPTCGQSEVGSTGQLTLLLVSSGFVGSLLYYGFLAYGAWRYRRDRTSYGLVGVLIILLSFIFMFTYSAVAAPLGITMLALAMLWRNDQHFRGLDSDVPDSDVPGNPAAGPALSRPDTQTPRLGP